MAEAQALEIHRKGLPLCVSGPFNDCCLLGWFWPQPGLPQCQPPPNKGRVNKDLVSKDLVGRLTRSAIARHC